jgi:hypothetical protein
MSCMTLTASEITMATTQFTRTACHEACWRVEEQFHTRRQPLRMNWVVVTDENGSRRLQIDWHAGRP